MKSRRKRRLLSFASATLALLILAGFAGCGNGSLPMADVRGEVKFDGQPIEKGLIAFHPEDGAGPSTGAEIVQGQFTARVPPGRKRVEVRGAKKAGKRPPTPENPVEEDIFKEFIPRVYNVQSTLSEEIKMPETVVNLDLKPVAGEAQR